VCWTGTFITWICNASYNVESLGDFRNWYVMNYQDAVLSAVNEDKMTLLDMGTKIPTSNACNARLVENMTSSTKSDGKLICR
jgi:hypothetical protein